MAQVRRGLEDFQGTAVEMKCIGHIAKLDNSEIATAVVAEENIDISLVGAGVGGGFNSTSKLKVMNYQEAIQSPNVAHWKVEVKIEKILFNKFKVLTVIPLSQVPKGIKIMTTVWAMKKKPDEKPRGRFNAGGYERIEGK